MSKSSTLFFKFWRSIVDKLIQPIHRERSCAVCFKSESLLMVEIVDKAIGKKYWMPPGGEVESSESLDVCAERETLEETGQIVKVFADSKITKEYSFEFEDQLYVTRTHFFLAEWLSEKEDYNVSKREEAIFSSQWVPLEEAFRRMQGHEEIQSAVYELISPLMRTKSGVLNVSRLENLTKK